MTVQCIACSSFSFRRAHPEMAQNGFGHCQHREKFIAHLATSERECDKFRPEQDDVVKDRREWLARRKG